MPRTKRDGVEEADSMVSANENSNSSTESSDSAAGGSTTRRRRGGRRVVRGTGAAGAALALKVEEREAKTRATRRRKAAAAEEESAEGSHSERDKDDEGNGRSSQRSGAASARTRRATGTRSRSRSTVERADAGASEESGDNSRSRGRGGRPMTSLLFQEPVLPASDNGGHDTMDDDDEDRHSSRRGSHSGRRSRSHRGHDDEDRYEEESRHTRSRHRGRGHHDDHRDDRREDRHEDEERIDDDFIDIEDFEREPRRRRSRRLNAEERHAADEVEQIEEDLEDDDITYRPITDFEEDEESSTRSRRRRRRGGRDEERDSRREGHGRRDRDHDDEHEDDERGGRSSRRRRSRDERHDHDHDHQDRQEHKDEEKESRSESRRRHRREHEEDNEEQTTVRRRRRRRGGKDEEKDSRSSGRSRKQQYIDEITDIAGSTRLEAKKQRRRDNRRERGRQNQLMEQSFLARRENVDRLMVVRERGHHTQISVIEDNVLVEHYVSDIQEVATVGNIYLGRVQNVLPSMEAAFVDIGQPRNGVLYAGEVNWDATRLEGRPRRIELAFKSGDPVLVQVTKDPIGHKGARLTSQVTLAGRFLVLVPSGGMTGVSRKLPERERGRLKSIVSKIAPKHMGVIIRTAAEGASEEALEKDLKNLEGQWEKIEEKRKLYRNGKRAKLLQGEPDVAIRVVRDIFNDDFSKLIVEGDTVYHRIEEYLDSMAPDLKERLEKWDPEEHKGKDVFDHWQIDSQLRKGMERQVYLPSGGSIVIDRTEAMTTIDVNTGRFIGKGKSLEETVTRCNLEASEEIARQLRLRDIGGMIMIDYVDMVMPANRDLVLRRLVECLARDRTKHQVAEVTSLGLVQMTRKRIGQGLVEAFSEECPTCKGRGFILHDEPTISSDYSDPYAMKGGDPFVHTNKHGHGTHAAPEVQAPKGSSPAVKAKLAQIAAAAVAANDEEEQEGSASSKAGGDAAKSKADDASGDTGDAKE
ncbi:Rne/Rng family ribonuclease [Bifidobacterium sp. ESL0763]|uniref:Rne/Rng family ribonuclease n=1 Tax=Bifidobacterium sp. ESL0763 TaxID=2983227 RepID=UPI0035A8DAE7